MEKISWTYHVSNEEVLLRVKEQRNILHEIRKRKANWIRQFCVETAFFNGLLKERYKGDRSDRKTRKKT
jgi:ribosomal protein S26